MVKTPVVVRGALKVITPLVENVIELEVAIAARRAASLISPTDAPSARCPNTNDAERKTASRDRESAIFGNWHVSHRLVTTLFVYLALFLNAGATISVFTRALSSEFKMRNYEWRRVSAEFRISGFFVVDVALDADEGLNKVALNKYDLLVCDQKMPGGGEGLRAELRTEGFGIALSDHRADAVQMNQPRLTRKQIDALRAKLAIGFSFDGPCFDSDLEGRLWFNPARAGNAACRRAAKPPAQP